MMEPFRSLLLVSPHETELLERAYSCGADCIVLDLMGCSIEGCKGKGFNCVALKDTIADALKKSASHSKLFVRASHPATGRTEVELRCVMSIKPEGVLLPSSVGQQDIASLSALLSVIEAQYGMEDGTTRILAVSGETSAGVLASTGFSPASGHPPLKRLYGLSWDEIALSSELGSEGYGLPRDVAGFARSMTLMAARAAKVFAFDTPSLSADAATFRRECQVAMAAGYEGKIALYPDQVPVINEIFA